ncbi:T9SS type A sorting domain-containing protein [Wenyingzhuangia sp. IMCC45467]
MKKITLLLMCILSLGAYSQSTFYYEDFRYDNGTRGFTIQTVSNSGQTASELGKRISDVPDASDSSPVFSSRSTTRIPNGGAADQRAISFALSNTVNYAVESWAILTSQDLSAINGPKVSFWSQARYADGNTSSIKIMVSSDYVSGNAPSTANWTDETANITGNIATSGQNNLTYVFGQLDLSAYSGTNVTVAFKVQGDDSEYSSSNRNGTYWISDIVYQNTPIDVATGAITLNVSSSSQSGIFDEPTPAISEDNYLVKYFDRIFTTETYSTRFVANAAIPAGEGVVFKVADIYNPIKISEFKYSIRNAQKEGYSSLWKIEASNDNSTWTDVGGGSFTPIQDGNADVTEETKNVNTNNIAYRYYRMVLAEEFPVESNTGFIEFQEANFTVTETTLSSTNINTLEKGLNIYPNPTSNVINISNINEIEISDITLIDVTGNVLYNSNTTTPINVQNLNNGIYILKITATSGNILTKKIIVN